MQFAQ